MTVVWLPYLYNGNSCTGKTPYSYWDKPPHSPPCGPSGNWETNAALICAPLHWRQNDHDGVSNHQPHGCLLNRLFRCRSKKTSKLRVTGLCAGNSPGPVNSPHKRPVTRKMFPFDDVIMLYEYSNQPKMTWWEINSLSPGQNGRLFADDISICIFVNETFVFWSWFLRVQLAITQHWLDNGLTPNRREAIIWTNADQTHWRIYAALGGRFVTMISMA